MGNAAREATAEVHEGANCRQAERPPPAASGRERAVADDGDRPADGHPMRRRGGSRIAQDLRCAVGATAALRRHAQVELQAFKAVRAGGGGLANLLLRNPSAYTNNHFGSLGVLVSLSAILLLIVRIRNHNPFGLW